MANKSISQLTAGGAVAGTDLFPDVQTVGVGPVKVTASQMGNYFLKGTYTSNTLVYDSANSRIGIGTTSPALKLHVAVPVFQANASGGIRIGDDGNNYLVDQLIVTDGSANPFWDVKFASHTLSRYAYGGGNNYWSFYTNNTEKMRITSAGNVGIGIASPGSALQVTRAGAVDSEIAITNGTASTFLTQSADGNFYFYKYGAYAIKFGTNGTEKMTILSGGNVGIATASPAQKLDVNGNIKGAQIYSAPTALTSGATITWNTNTSPVASLTLADVGATLTPSNLIAGGTYLLIITQGTGGNKTITTWTNFKWVGGAVPTLSTAAGAIDIITGYSDGTYIYASAQYGFA